YPLSSTGGGGGRGNVTDSPERRRSCYFFTARRFLPSLSEAITCPNCLSSMATAAGRFCPPRIDLICLPTFEGRRRRSF
ncbi:hypothetical protein PMAYCL1PPCAC_11626, partial [Pristionchus mayeri]